MAVGRFTVSVRFETPNVGVIDESRRVYDRKPVTPRIDPMIADDSPRQQIAHVVGRLRDHPALLAVTGDGFLRVRDPWRSVVEQKSACDRVTDLDSTVILT